MEGSAALDRCHRKLKQEFAWTVAFGIAAMGLFAGACFPIDGCFGDADPGMPVVRKLLHLPFTCSCLLGMGGSYLLLHCWANWSMKNRHAIRAARTSELIEALSRWQSKGKEELRNELFERARNGDRRAKSYFYGRPMDRHQDRDGLWLTRDTRLFPALADSTEKVTVYSKVAGFKAISTKTHRSARILLVLPIFFIQILLVDWGNAFDSNLLEIFGALVIVLPTIALTLNLGRQKNDVPDLGVLDLTANQLMFILVNCREELRSAAARELVFLGRFQKPAEEACFRMGLYVPDEDYLRGYRVAGI